MNNRERQMKVINVSINNCPALNPSSSSSLTILFSFSSTYTTSFSSILSNFRYFSSHNINNFSLFSFLFFSVFVSTFSGKKPFFFSVKHLPLLTLLFFSSFSFKREYLSVFLSFLFHLFHLKFLFTFNAFLKH